MKVTVLIIIFFIVNSLFVHKTLAVDLDNTSDNEDKDEQAELLELMDILDEETTIATKTKLNSDYVPGMVSILQGDEMQALGKLTVWDALSLVPGIKTIKASTGTPLVVARGVSFPFNNGNIKIMLNSETMSSEISGMNSSLLLMPIEQVERIEFIRGPSSSVYGNSAYMGLVNIITRKNSKRFYIGSQEDAVNNGGGQYFWQDPDKDLHISANLAIQRDGDLNAPLNSDSTEDKSSFIFNVDYNQTSLTAQWFERDYSERNTGSPLQLLDNDRALSLTLKQKMHISDSLNSDINLSYRENKSEYTFANFDGTVSRAQVDFNSQGLTHHQLLLSMAIEHYTIDDATFCVNIPSFSSSCPRNNNTDDSWNNYKLSLQDQYALSDTLSLIGGIGFDRNTNTSESNITPRLAFVWQMADQHLFKGQYSRGFRSPTFFELYDIFGKQIELDSEQVDSYELGYIFKNNTILSRVTLFYSELDQLIFPEGRTKKNNSKGKTQGIEFEWQQKINQAVKWSFNVTYTDSDDDRGEALNSLAPPEGVSDWLGNVVLYFQPSEKVLMTAHYHYVSEQSANHESVDGYNKLDLTLNLPRFLSHKVTFRMGVKNALDSDIRYLDALPRNSSSYEYPGRTWWTQFTYEL